MSLFICKLTVLRYEHVACRGLELEDILDVALILLEPVHVVQRGAVIIGHVMMLLRGGGGLGQSLLHLAQAEPGLRSEEGQGLVAGCRRGCLGGSDGSCNRYALFIINYNIEGFQKINYESQLSIIAASLNSR